MTPWNAPGATAIRNRWIFPALVAGVVLAVIGIVDHGPEGAAAEHDGPLGHSVAHYLHLGAPLRAVLQPPIITAAWARAAQPRPRHPGSSSR